MKNQSVVGIDLDGTQITIKVGDEVEYRHPPGEWKKGIVKEVRSGNKASNPTCLVQDKPKELWSIVMVQPSTIRVK